MRKTLKDLLAEANNEVKTYQVEDALSWVGAEGVQFIDVRDEPEIFNEGKIPGAIHASRGMLEFYVDAQSPYHKSAFESGKKLIFYCKSGGRSALAAQRVQQMGIRNVAHVAGGFKAWKEKDGPVEMLELVNRP